jgi:hypothetical protein
MIADTLILMPIFIDFLLLMQLLVPMALWQAIKSKTY